MAGFLTDCKTHVPKEIARLSLTSGNKGLAAKDLYLDCQWSL